MSHQLLVSPFWPKVQTVWHANMQTVLPT